MALLLNAPIKCEHGAASVRLVANCHAGDHVAWVTRFHQLLHVRDDKCVSGSRCVTKGQTRPCREDTTLKCVVALQ